MVNYRLLVSGRVQGVGFRWATRQIAHSLQLTGLVKNLVTGQVYIEVQGPRAVVEDFITQIKAGPTPYSQITQIDKTVGHLSDYQQRFVIAR